MLHAALLPLNVVRLRQLKGLLRSVREATEDETIRSLVPYMQTDARAPGDVLFAKGDPADRLYIIERGHVRFPEIGRVMSDGDVFGEVGLFAPNKVRTLSAVCDDDCRLHTITRDKVLELYYQNPRFGFFLIRLMAGILERQEVGGAPARA